MSSCEPVVLGLLSAAALIWMISRLESLCDALNKRPLVLASIFLAFSAMTGVFLAGYWGELHPWHVAMMAVPLIGFAWAGLGVLFRWPGFTDVQRPVHVRSDLQSERPFVAIPVPPAATERGGRRCSKPAPPTPDRRPALRRADDRDLGEYMHGDMSWVQDRITEDGREFVVRGEGSAPIAEQIERWDEIDRRLPELVQTAIAAVVDPGPDLPDFSRARLYLLEIRMLGDGSVEVFLGPVLRNGDGMDEVALVVFCDWRAADSYWSA